MMRMIRKMIKDTDEIFNSHHLGYYDSPIPTSGNLMKHWFVLSFSLFTLLCSIVHGVCAPLSDAYCAQSIRCQKLGNCAAVDGSCKPTTNEHCAQSENCKSWGACSVVEGKCKATEDIHCAGLTCKKYGMCVAVERMCVKRGKQQ